MFVNKEKQLYITAPAKDLHAAGPELELKKLFDEIAEHILLTIEPTLVPGGEG